MAEIFKSVLLYKQEDSGLVAVSQFRIYETDMGWTVYSRMGFRRGRAAPRIVEEVLAEGLELNDAIEGLGAEEAEAMLHGWNLYDDAPIHAPDGLLAALRRAEDEATKNSSHISLDDLAALFGGAADKDFIGDLLRRAAQEEDAPGKAAPLVPPRRREKPGWD